MKKTFDLQSVINYIENNLCNNLNVKKYVQLQGYSYNDISKSFNSICNISIKEYICKRKLTLAALDLSKTITPICEIAEKYGYSSQENFARAIKQFHGYTPLEIRKTHRHCYFNKIQIKISCIGGTTMKTEQNTVKETKISAIMMIADSAEAATKNCVDLISEFHKETISLQEDLYKHSKDYKNYKKIYNLIKFIDEDHFEFYIGYETTSKLNGYEYITIKKQRNTILTSPRCKYPTNYISDLLSNITNTSPNLDFISLIYYWYLPESELRNKRYIELLIHE